MRRVWNNANAEKFGSTIIPVRRLVLNCATRSGRHPTYKVRPHCISVGNIHLLACIAESQCFPWDRSWIFKCSTLIRWILSLKMLRRGTVGHLYQGPAVTILLRIDPLLGNARNTGGQQYRSSVSVVPVRTIAMQHTINILAYAVTSHNREVVFSMWSAPRILTRHTCFL
jgi:hypothetical protein